MNILVTGGTGFIGSNLCKELVMRGDNVICIDNNSTGRLENIQDLLSEKNFRFILHDVIKPFDIDEPIDQIYHLACQASPPQYQRDPLNTLDTNYLGTKNFLNLAYKKRARFLLASTSEVYGCPKESPQKETYFGNVNTIGPRSCYDEGKRIAETLTYEYGKQLGVSVRIARIFNTYGPRMRTDDGRVITNFISQILRDEDITIYGDGSQTRSFCYISDTLLGLTRLMNVEGLFYPINIGNDNEITILELADMLLKMSQNYKGKLVFKSLPKDDPIRRKPDLSRARRYLGWRPQTELYHGLLSMFEYCKNEELKVKG